MGVGWEGLVEFYEEYSHFPRQDGERWDAMRYHCKQMTILIPHMQSHPKLSTLHPIGGISVIALRLLNTHTDRLAFVFVEVDDTVNIRICDSGTWLDESVDTEWEEYSVNLEAALNTLESALFPA